MSSFFFIHTIHANLLMFMGKIRLIALSLLIVGAAIGFFVYSSEAGTESKFPFRLGLDLSGGAQLTYRADVSDIAPEEVSDAMNSLRDVIERRVNLFGVSEPLVQTEQSSGLGGAVEQRLIVELPGVTDIDEAIERLGETPLLEFKLLDSQALALLDEEQISELDENLINEIYIPTELTGRFLKSARLTFDSGQIGGLSNEPIVAIEFDERGAEIFAEITREHIGETLAIFLDGVPISQPVIQTEIESGSAVITGSFSPEEGRELARNLNFGALPVPIELIGTQTVGATLGADILSGGMLAALIGLAAVALFMIFWYRLPGLLAVISLAIYVAVILALFKLIPVTLTAAGIAGFILSVGMAVDANILIFERLKEELAEGKELDTAVREGFARAWLSIRDGNLSTLLTAIILFWFGTSVVEGFALVLGIGVLVSMITAISVTRTLLLAVARSGSKAIVLFKSGFSK